MNRKIIFEGILLLLIFASIWGIFTLFPIFPKKTSFGISVDKEESLGDLMVKSLLNDSAFREVKSDTLDDAIAVIRQRLVYSLDSTQYIYHIIVFNNSMVNAFTLPGGYILVSTGLIKITDTPEELAAVIAHEMGHVENRHVISRLAKNFTISILMGDNELLSEASRMVVSSAFDRSQEAEADRFGLNLLEKAHINPRTMGTVFRKLKQESGNDNGHFEIIMSHPDLDSRIKAAYDFPIKPGFKAEKLNINWNAVKRQFPSRAS